MAETTKILSLYPTQLRVNPDNVRYSNWDKKAMVASILAPKSDGTPTGVISPLIVEKTKEKTEDGMPIYLVLDGNCRAQSLVAANEKAEDWILAPAIEKSGLSPLDRVVLMLTTGTNSQPLNMLERAYGIQKLETENGKKMKDTEVAKILGVSSQHVADCRLLLTASPTQIKQIKSGALTASSIVEFLKNTDDSEELDSALTKAGAKAAAEGRTKLNKAEVEEAAGAPITRKSASASRSTKAGAAEVSGPAERMPKEDVIINKLVTLQASLEEEEAEKNPVAFAALQAIILYAKGKMQPIDMYDIFFGDGSALPEMDVEEAPAKKAPAKKAAAKKESTTEEDEEAVFDADADQGPAGKKTAPVKKAAAAPAKEPLLKKGESLKDKLAKAGGEKAPAKKAAAVPVKPAKKAAAPVEVDEEEDFEEEIEQEIVKATKGKKAPIEVEEEDEDDFVD